MKDFLSLIHFDQEYQIDKDLHAVSKNELASSHFISEKLAQEDEVVGRWDGIPLDLSDHITQNEADAFFKIWGAR